MTRDSGAALTTSIKIAFFCCIVLAALAASAQKKTAVPAHARRLASGTKLDAPSLNYPPPTGPILDLSGTPIPGGGNGTYQQYTVNFSANITATAITIAFRDDPAYLSVAEVSVVDVNNPNVNLLVNGDFSQGTYSNNGNDSAPVGWTFVNQYGASDYGIVTNDACSAPLPPAAIDCWYDGSVQAYDALSQTIATTVGDIYQISFWVAENSSCSVDGGGSCNFSDLSTDGDTTDTGGNGINVTVYAQNGVPPATQPLKVMLLDSGSGTVTDNLEAIDCSEANGTVSGTCSTNYSFNQPVTLTAQANVPTPSNPASTFTGWGGDCAAFGTNTQCTLTMNGAKNVTASFDLPGQTQTGTVTASPTPTTFNYNGGFQEGQPNSGYDYSAQEDSGQTVQMAVTAIPISQAACNQLVQANPAFQSARCFVYQNSGGQGVDESVMFEVTCPPNGSCGSTGNPFNASLASDFSFDCGENSSLACPTKPPAAPDPGSFGFPHLTPSDGLPSVGLLKGTGPDENHPCTPYTGNNPQPLFQSNQIISLSIGDTSSKPIKGGSAGSTSCWVATYLTQNEAPTISVTQPVNNGIYQQNQTDLTTVATYACSAMNNSNVNGGVAGPFLSVPGGSCYATDNPGGSVPNGTQFDTHTPGSHTFTAYVQDSALNTNSQIVTYNVFATQAINFTTNAPSSAAYGGSFNVAALGGLSGNPVMFTSSGSCTNNGAMYTMTSGTGSCLVIANQAGNTSYSAAQQITQTVNATPAPQAINFTTNPPASAAFNSNFPVAATGGASGNPVVFTSSGACTNIGTTFTMTNSTGNCSVIANQAGNTNYSAAPTITKTVSATGTLLSVTPSNFNLGTFDLNFALDPTIITVKNLGNAAVNFSNVSLTLGAGTNKKDFTLLNLCPSTLGAGKTCYMSVVFFAGNVGAVSATLNITDNAPGSPQHVTFAATVINPLASFNPTSLSFATTKVGHSSSSQNIVLTNPGTTALNIQNIGFTGPNPQDFVASTGACPSSLNAGAHCTITVTFTPKTTGSRSAYLTVTDNAPLGKQSVGLSGRGN